MQHLQDITNNLREALNKLQVEMPQVTELQSFKALQAGLVSLDALADDGRQDWLTILGKTFMATCDQHSLPRCNDCSQLLDPSTGICPFCKAQWLGPNFKNRVVHK